MVGGFFVSCPAIASPEPPQVTTKQNITTMKPIILITLQLLLFVAAVLALAWALPLWATAGIILLLQIFQLTVTGTTLKLRNDHDQED